MSKFEEMVQQKQDANEALIKNLVGNNTKDDKVEDYSPSEDSIATSITTDIKNEYKAKKSKKTLEDSHVRVTFLLDRETNEQLNRICDGKRGLKTLILNKAVKYAVDNY